jgi:hypothetical protein
LLAVLTLHALLLAALMLWRAGIGLASPGTPPLEISVIPPSRDRAALPPLHTSPRSRSNPKIDAPVIILLPPQSSEAGFPDAYKNSHPGK